MLGRNVSKKELNLLEGLVTDIDGNPDSLLFPAEGVNPDRIAACLAVVLSLLGYMYGIFAKAKAVEALSRFLRDWGVRLYLEENQETLMSLLRDVESLGDLDQGERSEDWEKIRGLRPHVEKGLRELRQQESASLESSFGSSLSEIVRRVDPRQFLFVVEKERKSPREHFGQLWRLGDEVQRRIAPFRSLFTEEELTEDSSASPMEDSLWAIDIEAVISQPEAPPLPVISQPEAPPAPVISPSKAPPPPPHLHLPSEAQREIMRNCEAAVAAGNFVHLSPALRYSAATAEEFPWDLEAQITYMRILDGTIAAKPRFRDRFAGNRAYRLPVVQGLNRFTDDTFVRVAQHVLQSLPFDSLTPEERRLSGLLV